MSILFKGLCLFSFTSAMQNLEAQSPHMSESYIKPALRESISSAATDLPIEDGIASQDSDIDLGASPVLQERPFERSIAYTPTDSSKETPPIAILPIIYEGRPARSVDKRLQSLDIDNPSAVIAEEVRARESVCTKVYERLKRLVCTGLVIVAYISIGLILG